MGDQLSNLGLNRLGYSTESATGPEEALRLARAREHPYDLLLTDVVMPGMNGRELFQRLRERWPQLRCLYMSGYTADVIAHHGVLEEGADFLQKPFTRSDLAALLRRSLDRAPP